VFALLIGVAGYRYFLPSKTIAWETIQNTTPDPMEVKLADGSSIYLNAKAALSYAENFDQQRTVQLTGEAFFDVKRDEHHPFKILVEKCAVEVLGTSFLITPDSMGLDVIVKTGRVQFTSPQNQNVLLEPGEIGTYRNTGLELSEGLNNDPNRFAWQTKTLVFENTPFDKVIGDVEKFFKVKIEVAGDKSAVPAYTSIFRNPELKDVLEEMKLVMPIAYALNNNTVRIKIVSQ
jgi:ferric-dicitrate binding protein FerR (iron transport regulator)